MTLLIVSAAVDFFFRFYPYNYINNLFKISINFYLTTYNLKIHNNVF